MVQLNISLIYITPKVKIIVDSEDRKARISKRLTKSKIEKSKTRRIESLLNEVLDKKQIVILGDPGSGKTVCLIQLALDIAKRGLTSSPMNPLLPIFIPLSEYKEVDAGTGKPQPIENFIRKKIQQMTKSDSDISDRLDILLRDKRLVFFFDAMDEMPRSDYYARFQELSKFMNLNAGNMFVFSCRFLDYIDDPTFNVHQVIISPFSKRQIKDFFKRYIGKDAKMALNALFMDNKDIASQSTNPFFLSLIVACIRAGIDLPSTWVVLIRKYINVTLNEEGMKRDYKSTDSKWIKIRKSLFQWLSELAYRLVENKTTGTMADRNLIEETLQKQGSDVILKDIAIGSGILKEIGDQGDVRFQHHKIQEYFAAHRLAEQLDREEFEMINILDDIWWQEVAVMSVGLMNNPESLIEFIIPDQQDNFSDSFAAILSDFNRTLLAIRCFHSTEKKENLLIDIKKSLSERLLQFLTHGNILQKVRSLRIAPLIDDPEIVRATRQLLHDPSKWVRESAFFSLSNMITATPSLIKIVWQETFNLKSNKNMFNISLRDFPTFFSDSKTRMVMPFFALVYFVNIIRSSFLFLTFFTIFLTLTIYNIMPILFLALFILLISFFYKFSDHYKERYNYAGLSFSFGILGNASLVGFIITLIIWSFYIASVFIWDHLSGVFLFLVILIITLIYATILVTILFRRYAKMIQYKEKIQDSCEKYEEEEQTVIPMIPINSLEIDRNGSALNLIALASKQEFHSHRMKSIRSLYHLLPLDKSVLQALENYIRTEPDKDIRDETYKLISEIELSIRRRNLESPEDN